MAAPHCQVAIIFRQGILEHFHPIPKSQIIASLQPQPQHVLPIRHNAWVLGFWQCLSTTHYKDGFICCMMHILPCQVTTMSEYDIWGHSVPVLAGYLGSFLSHLRTSKASLYAQMVGINWLDFQPEPGASWNGT